MVSTSENCDNGICYCEEDLGGRSSTPMSDNSDSKGQNDSNISEVYANNSEILDNSDASVDAIIATNAINNIITEMSLLEDLNFHLNKTRNLEGQTNIHNKMSTGKLSDTIDEPSDTSSVSYESVLKSLAQCVSPISDETYSPNTLLSNQVSTSNNGDVCGDIIGCNEYGSRIDEPETINANEINKSESYQDDSVLSYLVHMGTSDMGEDLKEIVKIIQTFLMMRSTC